MNWKRPENVAYPTIWGRFEGKRDAGGKKNQYWIQDLTRDYYDEILHHMSTGFVTKSPICIYTNFLEDQQSIDDYIQVWKKMFELRLSLICLTKDANNVTKFVGCNLLGRRYKNENRNIDEIFKGRASRVAGRALYHVYQNCIDIFTELNIEEYVSAFGLYVLPEYRGDGIGYQLLQARRKICLAVGIEVSVTAFTTVGGQRLAEKLGFKNLLEIAYEDLEKINPLFRFPGIEKGETKTIKLMYKRYN
ncbi:uncharacterized protein LOC108905134 [Anoplophora glabripennis]|uniref:uncharacterized protein LOC108905134 n=1 Tax=Anoplophora glabripennis TaxID=217634 RepID=UPI000873EA6E|nr:uncharacterized protein LOC108905134 [Anoplophora glabripennis]